MRILVTGGAGFKGAVLCKDLLCHGHEVTVIDNLRWGAGPLMHLIHNDDFRFVKGDIRNVDLVLPMLKNFDAIINLAAIVGHPECDRFPQDAREVNLKAVQGITRCLSSSQMFIQASTGSVYGKLEETCTELSPTVPLSLYGSTKLAAEDAVRDCGGVSLRFATAFGVSPCMRFDVVPSFFMWKALNDGYMVVYESGARRTLVDVQDMSAAYLFTLKNWEVMHGQVFNVGDETLNVTKRQVVLEVQSLIKELEGRDIEIFDESTMKDKDARDYEVSYEKIREIGFECRITLRQGLINTYKAAKVVMGSLPNPWRFN
jgi:nucleoside-diphosphate-sugar epimerase